MTSRPITPSDLNAPSESYIAFGSASATAGDLDFYFDPPDAGLSEGSEPEELDFVTMGMFIIDEIHFPPPRASLYDIPGGGGLFALYGSRMFLPPPIKSRRTAMIIDLGHDFPPALLEILRGLNTSTIFRTTPERATTRSLIKYGSETDPEYTDFKYLTPKNRIEVGDFFGEGEGRWIGRKMRSFHMICSCKRAIKSILDLREYLSQSDASKGEGEAKPEHPLILFEPIPSSCAPSTLPDLYTALPFTDVLSPNDHELALFFSDDLTEKEKNTSIPEEIKLRTERLAEKLASRTRMGAGGRGGAVIVRCGARGCYVVVQDEPEPAPSAGKKGGEEKDGEGKAEKGGIYNYWTFWLPPYYTSPEHVVDPTGAGNAFMGGLAVGFRQAIEQEYSYPDPKISKWYTAIAYASIAASFIVEQAGVPVLTPESEWGVEMCNGDVPAVRVREYMERVESQGWGAMRVEGGCRVKVGFTERGEGVEEEEEEEE